LNSRISTQQSFKAIFGWTIFIVPTLSCSNQACNVTKTQTIYHWTAKLQIGLDVARQNASVNLSPHKTYEQRLDGALVMKERQYSTWPIRRQRSSGDLGTRPMTNSQLADADLIPHQ
jgi:hypothetical protein